MFPPCSAFRLWGYCIAILGLRYSCLFLPDRFSSSVLFGFKRRRLSGIVPRRRGFGSGPVHVGFVVDKVALGQVSVHVLWVSFVRTVHRTKAML
jgi:hypothetical protein